MHDCNGNHQNGYQAIIFAWHLSEIQRQSLACLKSQQWLPAIAPTPTYQKHEGQLRTIFISFFPLSLQPSKWDINRDLQAGRLATSKTEHTHCKLAVPPRETQCLPPLWQLKLAALSLCILSDTDYYLFEVHLHKSDVHNKAWSANPSPHKHTMSIWKKKWKQQNLNKHNSNINPYAHQVRNKTWSK